jgi:hypothetical protein
MLLQMKPDMKKLSMLPAEFPDKMRHRKTMMLMNNE